MIGLGDYHKIQERVTWSLKDITRRMGNLETNYRNLGKHQRSELRRQDQLMLQEIQDRDAEIAALEDRVKFLEGNSERQALAIAGLIDRIGRLTADD